ncbi:MAG: hypothetical protein IT332_14335 [Ardenticatenales bacterium]|nr:hypothetical protein [Ardenticatenales bacterium]
MPELPPPYWESPLDRPKLAAVGVGLALVVLLSLLRSCGGDSGPKPVRAPEISTPPAAVIAAGMPVTVSGKAAPGLTVRLLDNDARVPKAEVTADADGNWSVGAPTGLKDGAHRLVVAVEDALGQTAASTPFTLTIASATPTPTAMPTVPTFNLAGADVPFIDLTDPASVVWPVLDGALSAGNMPTLVGSAAPGADIRFWEGRTPVGATQSDANGRWSFPLPDLSAGTHRLKVEVTGGPQNKAESAEWVVTVEGGTAAATASGTPAASGTPGATGTPGAPAGTARATATR